MSIKHVPAVLKGTAIIALFSSVTLFASLPSWADDSQAQSLNDQTTSQSAPREDHADEDRPAPHLLSPSEHTNTWETRTKHAEPSEDSIGTNSSVDSGSIFDDRVGPVVVLGDSFSSGEGSGATYYDNDGTTCHRSKYSYGGVIGGKDTKIIACSGATTANILDEVQTNRVGVTSTQLDALRALEEPPGLVFLTIGGNNLGFSKIFSNCLMGFCFSSNAEEKQLFQSISDMRNTLTTTYRRILEEVNSPENVEKRGGKAARLIVSPYPDIFPQDTSSCKLRLPTRVANKLLSLFKNSKYGWSPEKIELVREATRLFNNEIEAAVGEIEREGSPIGFVKDVAAIGQPNHSACSDEPYFNGVSLENAGSAYIKDFLASLIPNRVNSLLHELGIFGENQYLPKKLHSINQLGHPNIDGYQEWANTLLSWSETSEARSIPSRTPSPVN